MQIKIKNLPELIKGMNPEAVLHIRAGGVGSIDYSTSDIELVESDGIVLIQETSHVNKKRYDILDVPDEINKVCDKLVVYKSYMASLSELSVVMHENDSSFSGVILIDTLLKSGNSSNRFLRVDVTDGVIDSQTITTVNTVRNSPIRVFSNKHLANHPSAVEASVLTTYQKQLLLKGISI